MNKILHILFRKSGIPMKKAGIPVLSLLAKKVGLLIIGLFVIGFASWGQAVGDYQTNATGTWNWNTAANWQRCVAAGTWVGATNTSYPGQNPGAGTVTILNNTNVTITANVPNAIGALTVNNGNANSSVSFTGAFSLTVTGATSITGNTNLITKSVSVGTGTLTTGSISINSGNGTKIALISISTGTINCAGNIAFTGTAANAQFTFSGSGTLNLGGGLGAGGTFTASSGTIDFNGSVAQTIPVSIYNFNNIQVDNTNVNGATFDAAVNATDITGNINVNSGSLNTGNFAVVLAPSRGITVALGATFDAGTTSIKFGTTPLAAVINGTFQTANTTGFSGAAGAAISSTNAPTITLGASSTVEYTVLTGGQTITGQTYSNLMLDNTSGSNTAGGGITVNGTLTTTAGGTLDMGAVNILSLGGSSSIANAGTIKTSVPTATSAASIPTGKTWGGTIEYGTLTGAQTVVAGTYNNLKTDNTSGTNATGGNLVVNGTLTTTAGGILDMGASNILSGTLSTITNNGTIKTSVPTATSATPIPNGKTWGGTVEYGTLTGAQTVVTGTYNNLKLDNTSGSNTTGGNITVGGTLTLAAGTFAVGANTLTLNGPTIAGTPASLSTTSSSNLIFGGTTAGVLIPSSVLALNNLSTSNTNSVTLQSSPTISGIFDPQGAGLSIGANILTLSGQVNCGTLTGGATSNITINGAGTASLSAVTLGNLTINRAAGANLCGNVTVNGTLTLTSGILQLGNYNLTLASTTAIAGTPFSGANMIETNGTGFLIRSANATNASFNGTFPVGNGSYYEPIIISGLTGAAAALRNVYVRSVPTNPAIFGNGINKYWDLTGTTVTAGAGATLSLLYNAADATGNQTILQPYTNTSGSWQLATGASTGGVNPMISTGNASFNGLWSAGSSTTYYSYQSGDWNTALTWTTDPSGTLSVNPAVPGLLDNVVILNGRTVSVTSNNKQIGSLEIRLGGYLDLTTTSGHTFGTVTGQGVLRLSSGNFPTGTFTAFVAATGGTVEYYNYTGSLSTTQTTYNHLLLTKTDNNATNYTMTLASDLTLNGNLTLNRSQGTGTLYFTIGNNVTARTITINGNITNNAGCWIGVGVFNAIHTINLYGDFTNNGTIRFTNRTLPWNNTWYNCANITTTGAADMFFLGATNNKVICNGITDFHRFVENKGTDQTYMLDVYSSNVNNFMLWAPNNYGPGATAAAACAAGANWSPVTIWKNLFVANGTLKLNSNITIPSLTEGGQDFNLLPTAQFWINGANVTTTQNINGSGYTATTMAGTLRISAGSFSSAGSAGIVLGSGLTPTVIVEGGTLDVSQIWTTGAGGTNISFTQTGGTINVRANGEGGHGATFFELSQPQCAFKMSGGTINILNGQQNDASWLTRLFDIRSDPANIQVTGGTININLPANTYDIISTAPFYDVNITRASGGTNLIVNLNNTVSNSLSVLNNLTINGNCEFNSSGSNVNLNIGGNFNLNAGGFYTPNSNTTSFNGKSGQRFSNIGTINGGGLYNLTFSNSSNTDIFTNDLIVRNNLTINSGCFLNDVGHTINVAGNITNSGTHTSQANGSIILNGGGAQTIGGNGNGVFGNLGINKAAGTSSFTANQTVNGNIRLASGILDINHYGLTLSATSNVYDALAGTTAVFSNTKMISLSGLVSDGGITKPYSAIGSFIFPIGNAGGYRPATIGFTVAPTTWGSVNVKLGARVHPLATSANALKYYWKVVSTGFTGIQPNSVSHTYHFINPGDINAGALANYIPGVYNPYAWTVINDVSQVNKINYNVLFTNVNYLDGEYTAGQTDAFSTVNILYSRKVTGNWEDADMWSNDPVLKWGGAACGCFPGTDDIVLIGDGLTYNHTVNVTAANKTVGSLTINNGSVLDLGTTTGHNFGVSPDQKITGSGKLRISSTVTPAAFPGGDFGNFLNSNGGTVEYYSVAASPAAITLPVTYNVGATPVNITNYNNLNLSPISAKNIILPNTDLTIFGNLTSNGSGTGLAEFNNQNSTHTITVNGSVNISSGTLEYFNTNATAVNNMIVNGDITVSSGATFDVAATNTATSTLTIQGNLVNNGTFNMFKAAGRVCDVTFIGAQTKTISGTGATTSFDILTVNKGTDRNSILEAINLSNLSLNTTLPAALNLTNGTFRLTAPLAITLTTTAAFTIPSSGCLSANGGTINIGQANNNAGDLMLQGRLEVLSGAVNIGNGGGSNNDIEYASAGNPEIIVTGGTLRVDGQVRRNLSNTLGSLWYTQSGGTVTVRGLGFDNTRAMFEVTNTGSQFNMSNNGILNIERSCGAAATYADAYITPATNNVTGGTLQFGNANTPAGQTFALNSSSPLGSVLIDGTTTNIVSLEVNPLTLVNDLTINGAASNFKCNGLNVTIGRNLTNSNTVNTVGTANGGYQPGSSTQITTFNGSSPAIIAGVAGNLTNFANFIVGSSSTVTLNPNSNLAVNTNLTLNSGTLADGGNTITVYGNIANNATHTSSAGNGIVLAGATEQVISGSGSGIFGNVTINNTNGVNMVDNSTINGTLTLSNGIFYIDDYKLTLGTSTTVTTGSTFGTTRMIAMNGVISDQGVVKNTSGTLTNYLLPIGVAGKYTPATFTISSPASGSIKVLPVNRDHPADNDANGNELAYYWKVVTTGLAGLTSATQVFNYVSVDVSGNESLYRGARYYNAAFTDLGGVPGVINTTNHTITVTGSFVDGEYTAGEAANFTNKHRLYSKSSGNWTDNIWAEDAPGNPLCGYYPNGNPVYIQPGHSITMNIDNSYAYSVDIPTTAVLDLADKLYSDLGFITGTGKMRLKGTTGGSYIFPGGNYDAFMADPTGQSTVEFYGTNTATLPLKPGNIYKPYQNVIFTDAGTKYMSAEHMKVLKNLTINNGASLNNTLQNKNLYIGGNWTDNNVTTSGFVPGSGLVSFEGTAAQQLTVVNNLTENFYDFRVSNPLGVSFTAGGGAGDVLVSDNLYLTNGVITTSATNTLTLSNTSPSAAIGGGTSSYVDGPLNKAISSGSYFNFPVGNSSRYGNVYVSNASVAGTWTGQYFNAAPTYNVNSKLSPIDQVSNNEYWWVSGPATAQGNVQLRWDANSGFASSTAASRSKIRVIEWNPTPGQWEYRGKILNDGGPNSGTVQTDNIISLASGANQHYLTIGMESLPTATITSSLTPSVCNDGVNSTTVTVALTGTAPWSLSYKLGTVTTTLTNIASSPASIVLTSASSGISGTGTYNFNITNVNDAVGIPGVKDYTTTAVLTVKPVPTPAIAGRTTVGTTEAGVAYSTTSVGGDTYTWTVTGGTIASGQNTAAITVNWGGAAGTGTVSVIETNGAPNNCSITKSINVTIVNAPTPNVTGSANVCANETGDVYSTPFVTGHTYVWTVTGGTFTGPSVVGGNDQITVNWGAAGPGSVKVDETSGSTVSNTLSVTINPLPSSTIPTVANAAMCTGGSAILTVTNAEAASDYNLYSGATLVTTVHSSTAGNYNFPAITPASTTGYTVQAVTQYGCKVNLSSAPTVTVNANTVNPALNVASPVSGTAICAAYNGPNATITAGSGGGAGAADLYEYSLNNGGAWNAYTSGTTINTAGASTNVLIRISRSAGSGNGCNAMSPTTIVTWPVNAATVNPILNTASPLTATAICAGYNGPSATITAGSGGSSGAADTYQYSINNGGAWNAYTSGSTINAAGATTNVLIRVSRSAGSYGCTATGPTTIVTWPVNAATVNPTLNTASPVTGTAICAGYNSGTVSITAGSGGSSGAADLYEYSINNGGAWNAYTSGNAITTTGATGNVLVRVSRSAGSYGCTATGPTTIVTWPVNAATVNPTLNTASPLTATAICAGYNGPSATITAGSGGSSGAADTYQYSINNGGAWNAYTSGSTINAAGATTNVLIRVSRSAGSYGCTATGPTTIVTWPVNAATVNPTLNTASPVTGTAICAGYNSGTVSITPGSGGSSGAADLYEYSINNGGAWNAYTSGNAITTTGATGNVLVRVSRSAGSYGCTATGPTTIVTWPVNATTVNPTLNTASPVSATAICAAYNSGTVSITPGSGGSSGAADLYEYSINNGGAWNAYTSGNAITTTGATGNILVRVSRSAGSYGCTATGPTTIVTWPVNAATVNPTLNTASPLTGTAICAGYNSGTVSITAGSGGSSGAADLYEYSINNGGAWNAYTSGNAITTTGATGNVLVRVSRSAGSYGCTATGPTTIVTWPVNATTVNPTLNTASPLTATAICAGYNGPSATITAGSGGSSGAADTYQYSINNGGAWNAYTSGSTINAAGATTNVLIRVSRSAGSYGCTATGPTTIVTWPVNAVTVNPVLNTATPASGTNICAGYNSGTVTITAGSGGSSGAADSYEYSINNGGAWNAYTSGNAITTTGATGNVLVRVSRSAGSYGCTATGPTTIVTWPVNATTVNPTLNTASPLTATAICASYNGPSATITAGSGGSSGAADTYQYSINNGGAWNAYTSGSTINAAGATTNVLIRVSRSAGSYGCTATGPTTIVTWPVNAATVNPTLNTASPVTGTAICAGYNSGTVSITAGSGGSSGAADLYEYSINNGGAWNAYTSGNAITTTGATGNVLVRVSRSAGSYGCTATGPTTIVTWPVNAATVNPTLNTASPASGTGICIGNNGPNATINVGSGGSAGATDTYQFSINNGGAWSAYVSGSNINTAGAVTNVLIRASRSAGSYGCSATGPTTIVTWPVNSLPTPTFTVQPGANACTNTDVIYTTQVGQSGYAWSVPGILNTDYSITSGGVGATNNTVTLKWLTTGSKTITISYTDSNGCTAASPISSTATMVNPTPATGPVYRKPNN